MKDKTPSTAKGPIEPARRTLDGTSSATGSPSYPTKESVLNNVLKNGLNEISGINHSQEFDPNGELHPSIMEGDSKGNNIPEANADDLPSPAFIDAEDSFFGGRSPSGQGDIQHSPTKEDLDFQIELAKAQLEYHSLQRENGELGHKIHTLRLKRLEMMKQTKKLQQEIKEFEEYRRSLEDGVYRCKNYVLRTYSALFGSDNSMENDWISIFNTEENIRKQLTEEVKLFSDFRPRLRDAMSKQRFKEKKETESQTKLSANDWEGCVKHFEPKGISLEPPRKEVTGAGCPAKRRKQNP